jgi:TPP-dependent pyruvate/acetoin dehydrogenase alpha subunit
VNDTLKAAQAELAGICPPALAIPLGPLAPVVEGGFGGMKKSDWIVTGPRERIGAVLRGATVSRLVNAHAGARPYKLAPSTVAPGNRALHAVGLALGSSKPVLCFLGSASMATGAFHEALNTAALTQAPVIFLVAVTPITDEAPVSKQLAADPIALAKTHGISANNVPAQAKDIKAAVSKARKAAIPTLIQVQLEL